MSTKIFVSQIDNVNPNGYTASVGSFLYLTANGAAWAPGDGSVIVGFQGSQGEAGYIGSAGFEGSIGAAGPGYQGSIGATGFQGSVGAGGPGYIGSAGMMGSVGYTGSVGAAGPGLTGYGGSVGFRGSVGAVGFQGSAGVGAGGSAFTDLTDVPNTYFTADNKFVRVKPSADGLYFDGNTYITNSVTTGLNMNSNVVFNTVFKHYGEFVNDLGNVGVSGASLNITQGNVVKMMLTFDPVAIVINNTGLVSGRLYSILFIITQDGTGNRTIDWSNQTIKWSQAENVPATGPLLSTEAYRTDMITLYTIDAGTTWYGVMSVKGFG